MLPGEKVSFRRRLRHWWRNVSHRTQLRSAIRTMIEDRINAGDHVDEEDLHRLKYWIKWWAFKRAAQGEYQLRRHQVKQLTGL